MSSKPSVALGFSPQSYIALINRLASELVDTKLEVRALTFLLLSTGPSDSQGHIERSPK